MTVWLFYCIDILSAKIIFYFQGAPVHAQLLSPWKNEQHWPLSKKRPHLWTGEREICSLSYFLTSRQWPGFCAGVSLASPTSVSRSSSSTTRRSGARRQFSGFGTSKVLSEMKDFTSWPPSSSLFQMTQKSHQTLASMFTNPPSLCRENLVSRALLIQLPQDLKEYTWKNILGTLFRWRRKTAPKSQRKKGWVRVWNAM